MNDDELNSLVRSAFEEERAPQEVKDQALEHVLSQAKIAASDQEAATADVEAAVDAGADAALPDSRSRSPRRAVKRVGWIATGALAACLVLFAIVFVGGGLSNAGDQLDAIQQQGAVDQEGAADRSGQSVQVATAEAPTAYVDIDINPSIELAVSKDNIVLQANALNDDGAAVLSEVDPVGWPYDEAIALLMDNGALDRYIDPDSFVQFSVTADDPEQEQSLITQSEACLARVPCRSACDRVNSDTYHDAHEHGMGSGRYVAALELIGLDDRITLEDCKSMTMRQLRDAIAAAQGRASDEGPGQVRGQGTHHSEGHHRHHSYYSDSTPSRD